MPDREPIGQSFIVIFAVLIVIALIAWVLLR